MKYIKTSSSQGIVYKWTNTINGKWYIGSHKGSCNDGYIASGKAVKNAMSKYGMHVFIRDILYIGEDFREVEEFVLEVLSAATDKKSYNLKNTATGGYVWTGREDTEEYKAWKLAIGSPGEKNPMYKKTHTEEAIQKIRESKLGKPSWNKGVKGYMTKEHADTFSRKGSKHTKEVLANMSRNRQGAGNSNAKKVTIESGTYLTKQEACKALGLSLYKLNKILRYQDFRD